MKKQLLAIVSAICCALSMNAGVIYVKTSSENTAWNAQSTVYTNLQSAITAAQAGDEIWLAEGTYYVTNSADASEELLIEKSVVFTVVLLGLKLLLQNVIGSCIQQLLVEILV
nr:hypothetical protein [uncultured Carboxylicivirga sp.]